MLPYIVRQNSMPGFTKRYVDAEEIAVNGQVESTALQLNQALRDIQPKTASFSIAG